MPTFLLACLLVAGPVPDRPGRPSSAPVDPKQTLAGHWQRPLPGQQIAAGAAPRPGKGDFSIALWLDAPPDAEGPMDLLSQYDAGKRRGFHLTLKTASGVTSNQSSVRHLQFGIDDNRASAWQDVGRPGKALFAFSLATHQGRLYAGTCEPGKQETGRVHAHAGGQAWIDCGAPDRCNAVTALCAFEGKLYAGSGKYRLAGSALPESENPHLGGRVFRHEGGTRWTDCGRLPGVEAVGGLVVFRGRLYASSLYRPAGFFRYEGGQKWTSLDTPGGKRVVALGGHDGALYASSYDGGHVYRFDGKTWRDLGRLGENTQTYSFVVYRGRLHVGTWPSGRVYRLDDGDRWTDTGRLGSELEVMGMAVHNGRLIAGTLPLAEVYSLEGDGRWRRLTRLDHTPDAKYRRAWTMAEHQGRLFVSTLPSGRLYAFEAGHTVSRDHELPAGRHHVAAIRRGGHLELYLDGRLAARSAAFTPPVDLDSDRPLRLGDGENGPFRGTLADLRVYTRALDPAEVRALAQPR